MVLSKEVFSLLLWPLLAQVFSYFLTFLNINRNIIDTKRYSSIRNSMGNNTNDLLWMVGIFLFDDYCKQNFVFLRPELIIF